MQPPRFPRVVDDVTVRLIAAVVLVLAVLALVTHQWWIYAVLALDFTLRAALGPRVSPLAQLVQRAVRPGACAEAADGRAAQALRRGDRRRPDRRRDRPLAAARHPVRHRRGPGTVMVIFPALEAVLGLCVGCRVFGLLMRLGVVPEEICLECADISLRNSSTAPDEHDRAVVGLAGQRGGADAGGAAGEAPRDQPLGLARASGRCRRAGRGCGPRSRRRCRAAGRRRGPAGRSGAGSRRRR